MKKRLYGNAVTKSCRYCSHGRGRLSHGTVQCELKGNVSADHSCRKFDYDPMLRLPRKKPSIIKVDPEDFKL